MFIGNLNALRDWGHAKDYVEAQWLMLQQEIPEDFVIASGEQHSVRDFINLASKYLDMQINWIGNGLDEEGVLDGKNNYKSRSKYFRPTEVATLLGDASKAKEKLNWKLKISFKELVKEMIDEDLRILKNRKTNDQ